MADWYYIGHYGQLGPLTLDQMDELVQGGVVVNDTYVWRNGMADWMHAGLVTELNGSFAKTAPFAAPPPPPVMSGPPSTSNVEPPPTSPYGTNPSGYGSPSVSYAYPAPYMSNLPALRSDRSRTLGGVLQIVVPGVGRIYLGYMAYGVLQLVLTFMTCGFLWLWSVIDGILILSGNPKLDGYGRILGD